MPTRRYLMSKVMRGGFEAIPHVQGKRNPSKAVGVARGHQRADTLNHNHRKLANLITWTTALSNSVKLSHAEWGFPRWSWWRGLTECDPLKKEVANYYRFFALRTP